MLDTLLSYYQGPLFLLFPVATSLISMAAFLTFAVPLTWLGLKDPPSLRRYRIQSRPPKKQRLVWPSVRQWLVNNLLLFVGVMLSWPLLRSAGVHLGPLPPWYVIALQVLFFIYLDDFLFYWMHRTLHNGWLFKRIHSFHHRILTPLAITGHYSHPVEYILTGSLVLVGPLLLQVHVVTLWIWVIFRQWEAAEGHCGYDFPWSPSKLLPGSDGAVHHDFHHSRVRGNYAGYLIHTDRLFGTMARGYREDLERRH